MPLVFGRSIFGFAVVAGPPAPTWTTPDLTNASYDSVSFNYQAQEEQGTDIFFKPDGTVMYVLGETGDDINQYSLSTAWDISTASYVQNFSVASQETSPRGLFFKTDGTKMYVCGIAGDDVNEYSLSTAWDISTASYVQNFSVSAQETAPGAIFFKPDGTKMFIGGASGDDINEYSLSTAWDVSTASYSQNFSIASQETSIGGLQFSPDGTEMFVIGGGSDAVFQYSLTTGWDVSTASYDSVSFSVASQGTVPVGLFFKSDGSKMYVIDVVQDSIFQYSTVAPAWSADLSSASYDSKSFSFTSQDTIPFGLAFNNNGTKMYMLGGFSDTVYQYSLSTAFDVSTASYDSVSFSVASQDSNSFNITFNNNGTKMYMVGATGDSVYQYSLSTSFDMSTASYDSVSFSVASQDITPYDVAFGSSGTKMYIVGFNNDSLYQYSLSTAYDLSTASYDSVSFSVATQETQPTDFAISSDGTEIYVVGLANDTVYKYTLSTAWDLSTASYASVSFSVASQENVPRSVTFNSSGSKMYILGSQNNSVFQYSTVASAWTNPDLATASYDSVSFSTSTQETNPRGIAFKDDGTKMYVVGLTNDAVFQYTLSTAWDVSTASYDSVTLSVLSQDSIARDITFKDDGTSFYITGDSNNTIFQYNLTTAWDLSTASYASKSLSTSTQETAPTACAFKSDGTKVYVAGGSGGGDIYQYSLSTAWDISTGSYDSVSFDTSTQENSPYGIQFNPNGDKMWIVGTTNDTVYQYSLSTAWDMSTASYDSVSFSVATQDGLPLNLEFKSDGSKMYILGVSGDTIYQYST